MVLRRDGCKKEIGKRTGIRQVKAQHDSKGQMPEFSQTKLAWPHFHKLLYLYLVLFRKI